MRTRYLGISVLVAATALVGVCPLDAGGAVRRRAPTCVAQAGRAKVLARSPQARVWTAGGKVYGCATVRRKRVTLFAPSNPATGANDATYSLVRLAGTYVALVKTTGDEDSDFAVIYAYDLRRARRTAASLASPSLATTHTFVLSLVLDARGRFAWTGVWFYDTGGPGVPANPSSPPFGANFEVYAHDRTGDRLLDSGTRGTRIYTRSLRLSRGTVTWIRAGARQSARLS